LLQEGSDLRIMLQGVRFQPGLRLSSAFTDASESGILGLTCFLLVLLRRARRKVLENKLCGTRKGGGYNCALSTGNESRSAGSALSDAQFGQLHLNSWELAFIVRSASCNGRLGLFFPDGFFFRSLSLGCTAALPGQYFNMFHLSTDSNDLADLRISFFIFFLSRDLHSRALSFQLFAGYLFRRLWYAYLRLPCVFSGQMSWSTSLEAFCAKF